MSKKNELIPELRFPEFESLGNWKSEPISKLGETVNGLSGKKGADFGNGKPYVQYKQVFDESYIDFSECEKVDIKKDENQNKLQKGDILFTTSSETPNEVGFASVIINEPEEDTYLNSFCFTLRPFDLEKVNPSFSRYLFHSPIYRKSVSAIAQGSTRFNLSKEAFLKLKVSLPQLHEQQKIASCLSSLDELIAAHNEKLEALKIHKKGLLQKLFPQKGGKVPEYRFSEFDVDGEWIERKLGNEVTYFKGFAFRSQDYTSNGRRVVRVSDMGFDYVKNEEKAIYIKEDDAVQHEKWKLVKDDLIITTVGSKPPVYDSMVARTIVVQDKDSGSLLNQNAVCLRAKNIKQTFFNYLFKRREYINFIQSIIRGNANQGSITLENLFRFKICIPVSKIEQQKIASCFLDVDELITAQRKKIEQLQQHKNGLMRGLFPKIED